MNWPPLVPPKGGKNYTKKAPFGGYGGQVSPISDREQPSIIINYFSLDIFSGDLISKGIASCAINWIKKTLIASLRVNPIPSSIVIACSFISGSILDLIILSLILSSQTFHVCTHVVTTHIIYNFSMLSRIG